MTEWPADAPAVGRRYRLLDWPRNYCLEQQPGNRRRPQRGDSVVVVARMDGPPKGLALRCDDGTGRQLWQQRFALDALKLAALG